MEVCSASCISWETAYVLCWSQGWLYFISRQTRNWRTYFQGEKWQGTWMKNLLSWSRGDKVHCDYIDFKLLCRAGTSLCLVLLMMRRRKEEGMNTPLSSASKYFVTSMITESSLILLMFLMCKGKGVLASSVELKGDKRHSETETWVGFFFSLSSLPPRTGCLNQRSTQCPVQCVTDASSLCVPPALREMTLIGNRACLSFMHFWWKVLQLPIPQIITKLELIAINSTNICLLEVLQKSHYCLTLCSLHLFHCQWENYSVNKS